MKVFIIAAITADGFIGRTSSHEADWTGSEDKKVFIKLTKRAGTMVMGSRTFDTIGKGLPGRKTIVLTGKPHRYAGYNDVTPSQESPMQLVHRLNAEGVQELAVCGGMSVYDQFLQAGIVNELYLTVVPKVFGSGITLFRDSTNIDLELMTADNLGGDALLLHYKIRT